MKEKINKKFYIKKWYAVQTKMRNVAWYSWVCGNAWIVATCFEGAHIKSENECKAARPANFARAAGECEKLLIHGVCSHFAGVALRQNKKKNFQKKWVCKKKKTKFFSFFILYLFNYNEDVLHVESKNQKANNAKQQQKRQNGRQHWCGHLFMFAICISKLVAQ